MHAQLQAVSTQWSNVHFDNINYNREAEQFQIIVMFLYRRKMDKGGAHWREFLTPQTR